MAEAEIDKISELPDDVLLDILGRLVVTAGDVHAVARTSILSRRWRSLPWPQITGVSLDVRKFFIPSDEWQRVRRRRRRRRRAWEQDQRHATAAFTDALARFLEAPASKRVIEKLSLKFFLRRRDDLRRIGDLVGAAATGGVVKSVELKIVVTEMERVAPELEEQTKLGNGERFGHFLHDCPGAFRSITKLTLKDLWFHDAAELNSNLLRGCCNLQFLSLSSCGIFYPKTLPNADEPSRPPALTVDAPESRLEFLQCDLCDIGSVELVQAPALSGFSYHAKVIEDSAPISFGCTPSLKCLSLGHCQGEDTFVKLKLSELLVNGGGQLEYLRLSFMNGKIWLQTERPKQLRAAIGRLKYLTLTNIPPECNLSWAMFLLEAAPFLETLDIKVHSEEICNHICIDSWHEKDEENASPAWQWQPSPSFRHHHLKQFSLSHAFHVEKDLSFARMVMGLAVNLQAVTLGVKSLGCPRCIDTLPKYPELARSRSRFTEGSGYVDGFMKELMDGITSAKMTLHLADLV